MQWRAIVCGMTWSRLMDWLGYWLCCTDTGLIYHSNICFPLKVADWGRHATGRGWGGRSGVAFDMPWALLHVGRDGEC